MLETLLKKCKNIVEKVLKTQLKSVKHPLFLIYQPCKKPKSFVQVFKDRRIFQ